MSLPAFPATLPCPQTSTVTPAERRALSNADRPTVARNIQRERLEYERITWPPLNPVQSEALLVFWRDTLKHGGAWFTATWPLPRGRHVQVARKFREQPKWQFVAGGFWQISALCEVRGRGEPIDDQFIPVEEDLLIVWDHWHFEEVLVLDEGESVLTGINTHTIGIYNEDSQTTSATVAYAGTRALRKGPGSQMASTPTLPTHRRWRIEFEVFFPAVIATGGTLIQLDRYTEHADTLTFTSSSGVQQLVFDGGAPVSISTGAWHHVVWVLSAAGNREWQLDGAVVASATRAALGYPFTLGPEIVIGDSSTDDFEEGSYWYMDELIMSHDTAIVLPLNFEAVVLDGRNLETGPLGGVPVSSYTTALELRYTGNKHIEKRQDPISSGNSTFYNQWLTDPYPGSQAEGWADIYEAKAVYVSGDAMTGSAFDVWLPLGTTRSWGFFAVNVFKAGTIAVSFRRASDGAMGPEDVSVYLTAMEEIL